MDHFAEGVGEAILAAIMRKGQPRVVETEEMKDRGVQVVDVYWVNLGTKSNSIGRAVDGPPLDTRAGQPDREAVWVVIPTPAALGHGHPAELAAPDHEGFLEQTATSQILQQPGDRQVGSMRTSARGWPRRRRERPSR